MERCSIRRNSVLTVAALMAAGMALGACEMDDSRPSRPRTANPFTTQEGAQDRAERRALEEPGRQVPTGSGSDAPRQLNEGPAVLERQVVTLQAGGGGAAGGGAAGGAAGGMGGGVGAGLGAGAPGGISGAPGSGAAAGFGPGASGTGAPGTFGAAGQSTVAPSQTGGPQTFGATGNTGAFGQTTGQAGTGPFGQAGGWNWGMIGNYQGRTNAYNRSYYSGQLPHLPGNPGSEPMVGATPVPGTGWAVDHSWGQGMVLTNSAHRAWPETRAEYQGAGVKHNPAYYFNIQPFLPVDQAVPGYGGGWISNLYEIPWFYLNTAALPVLMILEPPFAQRTTERVSQDPTFNGHLPAAGTVVPTPEPGELRWTYPFLNPDGSVKERPGSTRSGAR